MDAFPTMCSSSVLLLLVLLVGSSASYDPELRKTAYVHDFAEDTTDFWYKKADDTLEDALRMKLNQNVAKNIIFFLGDGMGVTTVTAARIFKGQINGRPGEEEVLEFEKFPHLALVKTYNVDRQVPDSAATATAYLCGVKSIYYTVGLNAKVRVEDCNSSIGAEVTSIMQWAQDAGKSTGFVTTTRVTHASPAGLYAHSAYRYWEVDSQLPANASKCKDIASQLIEDVPGRRANVIMGGGRRYMTPESVVDPSSKKNGQRKDGKNLIKNWIADKQTKGVRHSYVSNKEEFDRLDTERTDYVLGLFDYNHMSYSGDRSDKPDGQPSLAEMTKKAIELLRRNSKGFFLFVEGGRIDHAHHDSLIRRSLEETVAMEEAITVAQKMTSDDDTLTVVTADHSHVLTLSGYPARGNPILGYADVSDVDNMTYTTLSYSNGPGYARNGSSRANLTGVDTFSRAFTPQVAIPLIEETHGGEDVAIYARGPMSHLFHGVVEQSYIPHALAYAACIGRNLRHCSSSHQAASTINTFQPVTMKSTTGAQTKHNSSPSVALPSLSLILLVTCICSLFDRNG